MPIELTEPQQRALDEVRGEPPLVVDPRTSEAYILVPAADYEAVREALEDESRRRAIRAVGGAIPSAGSASPRDPALGIRHRRSTYCSGPSPSGFDCFRPSPSSTMIVAAVAMDRLR